MHFTHVALFRAVNVGGRGLLTMSDLRALLADEGLRDAQTLLQSGNAVFDAGRKTAAAIEQSLERRLHARLSPSSDVFVRSAAEWAALVSENPFASAASDTPARLIVMVLKGPPSVASIKALQRSNPGREEIRASNRQLYIVYPDGMGRSKLTGAVIERALGTRGTARNWNTILKIAALLAP